MLTSVVMIVGFIVTMSKSILAFEKILLKFYLTLPRGPLSNVTLPSTIAAAWSHLHRVLIDLIY